MPRKAKTLCQRQGCPNLVNSGYCPKHQTKATEARREPFKALDDRKTLESRRFYSSAAWTRASLTHRRTEPLCRQCAAEGKTTPGDLVHHNPPLEDLVATGKNPLADEYLETICTWHHQAELRAKRRPRRTRRDILKVACITSTRGN